MSIDAVERLGDTHDERPKLPEGLVPRRRLTGGSRAFGDVFDAEDRRFNPQRPLRRVVRTLGREQIDPLRENLAAFEQRLAKLLEISAPHVGAVVEAGKTDDGGFYVVGARHEKSLALIIEEQNGALSRDAAAAIIEQMTLALAELHANEIVHGDIRPENIFIDRSGDGDEVRLTAWLEDAVTGCLPRLTGAAVIAGNGHDYRQGDYTETGDLRALGVTACELILGRDKLRRVLNKGGESRQRLLVELRHSAGWRGMRTGESRRRYIALVSLLFQEEPPLVWRPLELLVRLVHRKVPPPRDAREVAGAYNDWKRRRKRLRRGFFAGGLLAVTLACIAALAAAFRQSGHADDMAKLQAELSESQRLIEKANAQIAEKSKEIENLRRGNERIVELERQLADETKKLEHASGDALNKDQSIAELQRELDTLRRPTPRTVAERDWNNLFTDTTKYDKSKAAQLFVAQNKINHDVANAIKGHFESIENLRAANPWVTADDEFKNLHDAAKRHDWRDFDEVAAAAERLNALRDAAREWDSICEAADLAEFDRRVRLAKPDTLPIINAWYGDFLKTKFWKIELLRGYAAKDSKNATQINHLVMVKNGRSGEKVETPAHDWTVQKPTVKDYATYCDFQKRETRPLRIGWQPGDPIELCLYGDWTSWKAGARWNLIDEQTTGPMAMYQLHRQGKIEAGGSTVELRVLNCPGPPRGWNPAATAVETIKNQAEKLLPHPN